MKKYELDDTKRSTEYIIDEIIKSLDVMSAYASDVGLQKYSTVTFIDEIKRKLFDFYNVFVVACEEQKRKIEKEEESTEV